MRHVLLMIPLLWAPAACAADPSANDHSGTTGDSGTAQTADTPSGTSVAEGGSSDSTGEPDACTTPLGSGTEPIFSPSPGRFKLRNSSGYRQLTGRVAEGPPLEFHHEAERSGMCRLLTYEASTCDPMCAPPAVCIDAQCVTTAPLLSAGTVTLSGVGTEVIELAQDMFNNYFWDSEAPAELSMLTLTAAGDVIEPFDLSVCPVTSPTPTQDWAAQLQERMPGEAVTLTWSDPVATARIYLRMTTGIGTHGGISPVEIECEGPDVGALELPGAYLDALYAQGWSCGECGGNDLLRYHTDRTAGGGPTVEFRAEAAASFWHIP